jgi:succinoglycan biosynthesis protein ExoA
VRWTYRLRAWTTPVLLADAPTKLGSQHGERDERIWCPRISVVVPARDAAATLRVSVASALAQQWCRPLEVIVAAGPSSDATVDIATEIASEDARVRVVENPSGATGAALNAAVRASNGDVIARLDAHAVLPPGYLARAVEVLEQTGAANVGGRQDPVGTTPFEQAVAAAMRSRLGTGGAAFRRSLTPGPVDTVYLGVFRRDALEAVGGFDAGLLRNQDYELNIRLREAGGVVWFDPALRVEYRPRGSVRSLARQYYDYGRWKREVVCRHPGSLKLRQAVPPLVLVANVVGLAASAKWRTALAVPSVYAAAVLIASIRTGRTLRPRARARVPLTFPVMHFAWGSGFLTGRQTSRGNRSLPPSTRAERGHQSCD